VEALIALAAFLGFLIGRWHERERLREGFARFLVFPKGRCAVGTARENCVLPFGHEGPHRGGKP
jgi:hypothetical protein